MIQAPARPVIALLTDFGLGDHYVGAMKGVVLRICPEAVLVDISHDIPPHDILAGALELEAAYRYFPPGTIFVAVVDPGVGGSRRGLVVGTEDYRFVAPDNGVLAPIVDGAPDAAIVDLTNGEYALPFVSSTFEGRDRFAPAAAWLARGASLSSFGPRLDGVCPLNVPRAVRSRGEIVGEVLRVDRFGNLITNIEHTALFEGGEGATVEIGERRLHGVVRAYAQVAAGTACALVGSTNRLEIAVNGASATRLLGVGRGAVVRVLWTT